MSHPFNLIELDTVESTNNYAAKGIKESTISGFDVIMAYNQTNGRGQRGNTWQTAANENLTCSIVLDFEFMKLPELFDVNRLISLSIVRMLNELNAETESLIKWPNDILIYGRKLSGILIDILVSGKKKMLIIGVGLNVNQSHFEGLPNAVSMKQVYGKSFELKFVLEHLLSCFDVEWQNYQRNGVESLRNAYNNKLMGLGQKWQFEIADEVQTAEVLAVNEQGELLLSALPNKDIKIFNPKELKWLKPML